MVHFKIEGQNMDNCFLEKLKLNLKNLEDKIYFILFYIFWVKFYILFSSI